MCYLLSYFHSISFFLCVELQVLRRFFELKWVDEESSIGFVLFFLFCTLFLCSTIHIKWIRIYVVIICDYNQRSSWRMPSNWCNTMFRNGGNRLEFVIPMVNYKRLLFHPSKLHGIIFFSFNTSEITFDLPMNCNYKCFQSIRQQNKHRSFYIVQMPIWN